MTEKKFLSLKESSQLTGKSESTLKRLVQKIYKESKKTKKYKGELVDQIIKKEKAPKGFFYFISRDFIEKEFSFGQPMDDQKEYFERPKEKNGQPKRSDLPESEIIKILQNQLEVKDEQIKSLLERQRENNILIKNFQEKFALLEGRKDFEEAEVVNQKKKKEQKKGFWGKIFGRKLS